MAEDIKIMVAAIKEWGKSQLSGKAFNTMIGPVVITMRGIKEIINQPHQFHREKLMALYDIEQLLAIAEFVKTMPDSKDRPFVWYYLKIIIAENDSYLVVREDIQSGIKILYSIVDNIK